MKNIDFRNVAEMNEYLNNNGQLLVDEIPADIIYYDRQCKLNIILGYNKKSNFKISISSNNEQNFIIMYDVNDNPIDFIDIKTA